MTSIDYPPAPVPANEAERLLALYQYQLLDTPAEEAFDRLTRLAAVMTRSPRVQLTLIDADRHWVKSGYGVEPFEAPRELAFCAHTIMSDAVMIVPDARLDARFSDHPLVKPDDEHSFRFYAGAPLRCQEGYNLGALCIIDRQPRELDLEQQRLLEDFAAVAVTLIEARRETHRRAAAERLKDEFIATVSHELRTPLTSLQGALRLVESGVAGVLPAKASRLIEIAASNARRLTLLVNDVLDLERGAAGQLHLQLAPTDLRQSIEAALLALEPYAASFSVRFTVLASGAIGPVLADPDRLQQVLANLLSNAVKYSPPGGTVTVALTAQPDDIRVSISDTGPGVPAEFQARIFQKFAQADTADNRQPGSGLGLSIARLLVEAQGGTIGFTTSAGRGSTFWFTIQKSDVRSQMSE
jgi:signal transduction histidine kinase